MKKILTYCSLLVLAGCLTDGGVTDRRTPHTKLKDDSQTNNNNNSENTNPRKNASATTNSTLGKLSNIASISNTILNQNITRINNAFLAYNNGKENSEKIRISTNGSNENYVKALEFLAATKRETNPVKIEDMITAIDDLKTSYNPYKATKDSCATLAYTLKTSADFTSTENYAVYLQQNVNSSITNAKRGENTIEYITTVEKAYFNKLQKALREAGIPDDTTYTAYTDKSSTAYKDLMAKALSTRTQLESDLQIKSAAVLADLKKLDPTITAMPLTVDSIVSDWIDKQKILIAINGIDYLPDIKTNTNDLKVYTIKKDLQTIKNLLLQKNIAPTDDNINNALKYIENNNKNKNYISTMQLWINQLNTAYTAYKQDSSSTTETDLLAYMMVLDSTIITVPNNSELDKFIENWNQQLTILQAVKDTNTNFTNINFTYNSALEDYTIDLNDAGKSITFKASDFKRDTKMKSYTAVKDRASIINETAIRVLPNLNTYLNAGGSSTSEIKRRKTEVLSTFDAIKNNTATSAQLLDFENWTNGYITKVNLSNKSSDDYKLFTAVYNTLSGTRNSSLDIAKVTKTTDTVHLGGTYTGLSFADYGVWKVSDKSEYTGNSELIRYYTNNGTINSKEESEIYPFYSGLDSFKQVYVKDAGVANQTFTGNTVAYATRVGVNPSNTIYKDLTGSAKLEISVANLTGNLTLAFDNWYQFTIKDIDLSKKDGFNNDGTTTSVYTPKNIIGSWLKTPTFTTQLSGAQYGLEQNKPIEAVGSYIIKTSNDTEPTKYSEIKVEGAFGVKQPDTTTPKSKS